MWSGKTYVQLGFWAKIITNSTLISFQKGPTGWSLTETAGLQRLQRCMDETFRLACVRLNQHLLDSFHFYIKASASCVFFLSKCFCRETIGWNDNRLPALRKFDVFKTNICLWRGTGSFKGERAYDRIDAWMDFFFLLTQFLCLFFPPSAQPSQANSKPSLAIAFIISYDTQLESFRFLYISINRPSKVHFTDMGRKKFCSSS